MTEGDDEDPGIGPCRLDWLTIGLGLLSLSIIAGIGWLFVTQMRAGF